MTTLVGLLNQVLGDEPSDRSLWLATKRGTKPEKLALEVVERYSASSQTLDPVPAKGPHELRPAFLVDYCGRQLTPYDREFEFIAKSLNYSDQVAVIDELSAIADADDPERYLSDNSLGGFPECGNVLWLLRRIAMYGPLEEAGLLHYIDAPRQVTREEAATLVDEQAVNDLAPLVIDRCGYRADTTRAFLHEVIRADLEMWMSQFLTVMTHVEKLDQHIDRYLPEWFAGPDLLEWSYRHTMPPNWLPTDGLRLNKAVNQLITLPAPCDEVIRRLSISELLTIRSTDQMNDWRLAMRSGLDSLEADPSLIGRREFRDHLENQAARLATRNTTRGFAQTMTGAVQTGIAVAPVAALTGQDVVGTLAVGAAPSLARLLSSWFTARSSDLGDGSVRDLPAQSTALRVFLNNPATRERTASQRPPVSGFQTIDGKPIAFDIFNDWLQERYGPDER